MLADDKISFILYSKKNSIFYYELRGDIMYIDFIKNNYPDIPDSNRQAYINRDKKALISIVQEKIAKTAEEIVERWYMLSDIGFLPLEENFLDLLKEAEQLYCFGFYTGAIAVVGIACEEYCRYLVANINLQM